MLSRVLKAVFSVLGIFNPSLLASLEGFRGERGLPTYVWPLEIKERF